MSLLGPAFLAIVALAAGCSGAVRLADWPAVRGDAVKPVALSGTVGAGAPEVLWTTAVEPVRKGWSGWYLPSDALPSADGRVWAARGRDLVAFDPATGAERASHVLPRAFVLRGLAETPAELHFVVQVDPPVWIAWYVLDKASGEGRFVERGVPLLPTGDTAADAGPDQVLLPASEPVEGDVVSAAFVEGRTLVERRRPVGKAKWRHESNDTFQIATSKRELLTGVAFAQDMVLVSGFRVRPDGLFKGDGEAVWFVKALDLGTGRVVWTRDLETLTATLDRTLPPTLFAAWHPQNAEVPLFSTLDVWGANVVAQAADGNGVLVQAQAVAIDSGEVAWTRKGGRLYLPEGDGPAVEVPTKKPLEAKRVDLAGTDAGDLRLTRKARAVHPVAGRVLGATVANPAGQAARGGTALAMDVYRLPGGEPILATDVPDGVVPLLDPDYLVLGNAWPLRGSIDVSAYDPAASRSQDDLLAERLDRTPLPRRVDVFALDGRGRVATLTTDGPTLAAGVVRAFRVPGQAILIVLTADGTLRAVRL